MRRALVDTRTEYITTMRGLARMHGSQLQSCSTSHFISRLGKSKLTPGLQELIVPMLEVLNEVDLQLASTELSSQKIVEKEPEIQRVTLMQARWGLIRMGRRDDPLQQCLSRV